LPLLLKRVSELINGSMNGARPAGGLQASERSFVDARQPWRERESRCW
jgi:hypothetical protein